VRAAVLRVAVDLRVVEVVLATTGSAGAVAAGASGSAVAGADSITGVAVESAGTSVLCANNGVADKAMTAAIAVIAGRIVFLWVMGW
jgi:hypothetical protein